MLLGRLCSVWLNWLAWYWLPVVSQSHLTIKVWRVEKMSISSQPRSDRTRWWVVQYLQLRGLTAVTPSLPVSLTQISGDRASQSPITTNLRGNIPSGVSLVSPDWKVTRRKTYWRNGPSDLKIFLVLRIINKDYMSTTFLIYMLIDLRYNSYL